MAVEHHNIGEVAGADNRCVLDIMKAPGVVLLDDMLPPIGFSLSCVLGSPGQLKAAPGVRQQLVNAASAMMDPQSEDDDDDE